MQHFMSKISAKNVFIIIKTCQPPRTTQQQENNAEFETESLILFDSPQTPVSGALALTLHQWLCPWTPLGDFRPPDPLITPGFSVSPRIVGV